MVNYAKGKIYKIQNINGEGDIYIGSTTKEYLSQRMQKHRSSYKVWKAGKGALTTSFHLFDQYGVENCNIVLLEAVQAQSKDELHARESFWIRTLECVNKLMPGRSKVELQQKAKEYHQDHKEELNKKSKEYYIVNKVELQQKMKEYRAENKEELLQKKKEYYQDNQANILKKMKEKFTCTCGITLTIGAKAPHERTKKHQQFIKDSPDSLKTEGVLPV